jgi:NAD(P)-dependent dehydrogenase (short-subunit alcohol dehydrogenase family)
MMCRAAGSRDRFDFSAMNKPKVIVLAAGSDIGAHLARHFLGSGAEVVGTYRSPTPQLAKLEKSGARLIPLDITSREQVRGFAEKLEEWLFSWDILISAPGVLEPIGGFFSLDFDAWEKSFITNSTAQLRVLHAAYRLRNRSAAAKVVFFAGGGTNGPFDNYSAYCAGKLVLIKMTELLDSEYPDLQVSIIGTGWVNTKIHQQTLAAGEAAGKNFDRTREFLESPGRAGAALETVAECVDWCLASPRSAVGGRNFSVVHDPWKSAKTIDELNADPNRYKLRRLS